MANGEYIPVGAKPDRSSRVARAVDHLKYLAELRAEKDMAGRELLDRIRNLGNIGIQPVQFEIVYPMGRFTALASFLNPRRNGALIRADTIRRHGGYYHDYTDRYAKLTLAFGFVLPSIEGRKTSRLSEAILLDGTTGNIMKWGPFADETSFYEGWSPPRKAYTCDESGRVKFVPLNLSNRFEPRHCVPVWGDSLEPLSKQDGEYSIRRLIDRVDALATNHIAE